MPRKKALVVSPHPDDLEIGMGGTVCVLLKGGIEVVSLVVTDGRGSVNPAGLSPDELARTREREVRGSSAILGVDVFLLGFSDVKSEANVRGFRSRMLEFLVRERPDEMYLPHPEIDGHETHRTVSRLALECAARTASGENPFRCECWCYEVWTPFPSYDRIEDITPFVELKSRAIEAHRSQTAYKDYTDGVLGLNRYRGVFHDTGTGFAPRSAEVFISCDASRWSGSS